ASPERLAELPGVVAGQQHERPPRPANGAELGDGDLELREHLEQQRLGLDLDAVDLVDEQDHVVAGPDGCEQWTLEEEGLAEDVLLERAPVAAGVETSSRLDAQQLLAVVPLVERAALVEALVALQTDEPCAG